MGAIIRFSDIGPHGLTNRHRDLLLRLVMWLYDSACNGCRRFLRDVWALFYGGDVQASGAESYADGRLTVPRRWRRFSGGQVDRPAWAGNLVDEEECYHS